MSQEIPFPESDAREIANPSIDDGLKAGIQFNTQQRVLADIGEDPTPAGPDLVSQNESPLQRLMDQPIVSDLRERAQNFVGELPTRSRDLLAGAEQKAKANPWLTIAAASAGALAVGFLLGKMLNAKAAAPYTEEEYPAGYDE